MRRALHLLILLAILPGVMLPSATALCFCAAITCEAASCCTPCCGVADAAPSCCSERHAPPATPAATPSCRGCVVVIAHKPTSSAWQKIDATDAVAIVPAPHVALALVHDRTSAHAPLARPTSHAPPDRDRSLPLLI